MQMGFYFDQTRCIGCCTCVVACKDWNDVDAGPASMRRITTLERGEYPELFVAFLSGACYHCRKPACVAACPANAIAKRELDGIVVVEKEACLGQDRCLMCREACPYGAPQFGSEANARMQKCDFCLDRLAQGKQPACVGACPMRALDAGPIEQLRVKHGDIREAEGFAYDAKSIPSIVFKPKKDRRRVLEQ